MEKKGAEGKNTPCKRPVRLASQKVHVGWPAHLWWFVGSSEAEKRGEKGAQRSVKKVTGNYRRSNGMSAIFIADDRATLERKIRDSGGDEERRPRIYLDCRS